MTTDLLPEQERALAYANKRGTAAPLREIRARLESTYSELEALAAAISPEIARDHPLPTAPSDPCRGSIASTGRPSPS